MEIFLLIVITAIAVAVWWYKKNEPWEFLQNAKVVEKTEGRDLDHEKITGLMFGDGIDGVGYVIPPGSLGGGEELNRNVTRTTILWRLICMDGLEDAVHGPVHVRQEEGVVERPVLLAQEGTSIRGVGDAAVVQELGPQRRHPQPPAHIGRRRRRDVPAAARSLGNWPSSRGFGGVRHSCAPVRDSWRPRASSGTDIRPGAGSEIGSQTPP